MAKILLPYSLIYGKMEIFARFFMCEGKLQIKKSHRGRLKTYKLFYLMPHRKSGMTLQAKLAKVVFYVFIHQVTPCLMRNIAKSRVCF